MEDTDFALRVDWLLRNEYGEPVNVELHRDGRITVIHQTETIVEATKWAMKWLSDRGFGYWCDIAQRQVRNDTYITLYPRKKVAA